MTSSWGWRPDRPAGVWRYGPAGLRPLVAAVPLLTVVLLFVMMNVVSGSLAVAEGVLFDLPVAVPNDVIRESPVALVLPVHGETVVFFDDTRYSLGEDASARALGEQLENRFVHRRTKTLLVLSDRRVSGGDLMRLSSLVRRHGVARVFFAERHLETGE